MKPEDVIASLREAQAPPTLDWWPPALGWWLLAIVTPSVVGLWLRYWLRRRRRLRCPAWLALDELDELWRRYEENRDAQSLVRNISALLRRAAISLEPRADVAALTGDRWLKWLDQRLAGEPFAKGDGRLLGEAPYRRATDAEAEILFDLCAEWLELHSEEERGR